MKKSTLLSALTIGAVVATSAGSYAAWDTLSGSNEGSFTVVSNSAKLTVGALGTFAATDNSTSIDYTSDFTLGLENPNSKVKRIELTPTVTDDTGTPISSGYTVTITQANDTLTSAANVYTDANLATFTDPYTVKVNVTDKALDTKVIKVKIDVNAIVE